jgi:hypothetical protein
LEQAVGVDSFGISPLVAVLLADRYGEAGKRAAANMVELDY